MGGRQGALQAALLPCALAYGVLSAIRWPQIYAMTHMVIDYRFGFGKRGLLGWLMHLIDRPPYHYLTLAEIAFGVFALAIAVLMAAAWQSLRADGGVRVAFILFFLSAGFASLVCDVGRGEHFGLLLAAVCLLIPSGSAWLAVRAVLLLAAVLIQEANFVIFAPALAIDVLAAQGGESPLARRLLAALIAILPAAFATFYLGTVRTGCDVHGAVAQFQFLVRDFPIQKVPVATLCLNGQQNFAVSMRDLWSVGRWAVIVPLAVIVSLPSTIYNLWLALRLIPRRRLAVIGALATLSPPLLLLVAVDVVRFITLIQLTSLLLLVSAGRRFGVREIGTLPVRLRNKAVLTGLAAFQLGASLTLNDGSEMRRFPFQPLVVDLEEIINGHAPFVVIPTN